MLKNPDDKRGIILLSHHQPHSDFDSDYPATHEQLEEFFPPGKSVVWIFGHEHILAIYNVLKRPNSDFWIYPRLIGNGGFSNLIAKVRGSPHQVYAFDARKYQRVPVDMPGRGEVVGYNGYVDLLVND